MAESRWVKGAASAPDIGGRDDPARRNARALGRMDLELLPDDELSRSRAALLVASVRLKREVYEAVRAQVDGPPAASGAREQERLHVLRALAAQLGEHAEEQRRRAALPPRERAVEREWRMAMSVPAPAASGAADRRKARAERQQSGPGWVDSSRRKSRRGMV